MTAATKGAREAAGLRVGLIELDEGCESRHPGQDCGSRHAGEGSGPQHPGEGPSPNPSPAALLLDDFADALAAYTRISTRQNGTAAVAPRFVRARLEVGHHLPATLEAGGLAGFDVVICAAYCTTGAPDAAATLCAALQDGSAAANDAIRPGTPIGMLAAGNAHDGSDAREVVARAASACQSAGHPWIGGVIVTDGALLPRLMRTPRLGAWRRDVSEAVDCLVAAVRLGRSLDEVEGILGAGTENLDARHRAPSVIVASPHTLWRSVVSKCRRLGE
ncbi:hypothetical protein H6A10_04560 [Enorma massiliensis]|uniref:hypothetical protein n=1 Tax=Enorma massiliensis TaxID=1472761 RepID=UPI0019591EC6|nr:hypothetical protein [Enorma massiliensis]MBM6892381.1 hypothetical protein [Enorma massiliensis]